MLVEAHKGTKSALPYRALVSAAVLLAVTLALSGGMAWQRAGDALSLRIAPSGWGISFQVPRSFERMQAGLADPSVERFLGTGWGGRPATLSVYYFRPDRSVDANGAVGLVPLDGAAGRSPDFRLPGPVRAVRSLGPFEGVEVLNQQMSVVVRASILPNGQILGCTLTTHGGRIDLELRRLFELTCRSVAEAG